MKGWIKLHRKITEWEWYTDDKTFRLWIHILLKANHEPNTWQGAIINPGEFPTSREKLASEVNISEQSVRSSLNRLKSTNNITIRSTKRFSIIKVCNWESYQSNVDVNQPTDQPTDQPELQPANQPHFKEVRNKEERKEAPESLGILGEIFQEIYGQSTPNLAEHNRILKEFDTEATSKALIYFQTLTPEERAFYPLPKAGSFKETLSRLIADSKKKPKEESESMIPFMPNVHQLKAMDPR